VNVEFSCSSIASSNTHTHTHTDYIQVHIVRCDTLNRHKSYSLGKISDWSTVDVYTIQLDTFLFSAIRMILLFNVQHRNRERERKTERIDIPFEHRRRTSNILNMLIKQLFFSHSHAYLLASFTFDSDKKNMQTKNNNNNEKNSCRHRFQYLLTTRVA
jgi:hypothetical protein